MTAPDLASVWAGPIDLDDLGAGDLTERQETWRKTFADRLYGPIPAAPDGIEVVQEPLPGATRLTILLTVGDRHFEADAALWMPEGDGPFPVIIGLDFVGPIGILRDRSFPIDPKARVYTAPELGANGRLTEALRGATGYRWPVDLLTAQGYAVLVSCYGSWVPDDPVACETHGLKPFLGVDTGAISLWAWALGRLVDAATEIPGLSKSNITLAGHSRLGKAALWSGVNDPRAATVFANNAGAGGTAPARHAIGETLDDLATRFPHWVRRDGPLSLDQHHLMACLAPRRLYVASAEDDVWADPLGTYSALKSASEAWEAPPDWPGAAEVWAQRPVLNSRHLGHHIRPGGHDMLPEDWRQFLAWAG